MEKTLKIGDRVTKLLNPLKKGTVIEIHKKTGLAVIQWDECDFLGLSYSMRSFNTLVKETV